MLDLDALAEKDGVSWVWKGMSLTINALLTPTDLHSHSLLLLQH